MRHAPPVTYPLVRSRPAAFLMAFVWGVGVVAVLFWISQAAMAAWRQSLSLGLVVVCGLAAIRSFMTMPTGQIAWTGQHWLWSSPAGAMKGTVLVCLDIQHWLLLRFQPVDGKTQWLCLARAERPERWFELRRAVHARPRQLRADTDSGVTRTQ